MADDQDDSQKTEDPSQKRLDDARQRGEVPMSRELNHWFIFLAALMFTVIMAPSLFGSLASSLKVFLERAGTQPADAGTIGNALVQAAADAALTIAAPLALVIVAALAATFLQTGLIVSAEHLMPKLERLSPLTGITRQFSLRSIVEFLKGLAKIVVVGIVLAMVLAPTLGSVGRYIGMDLAAVLEAIRSLVIRLLIAVLSVMSLITVLDYLYQRFEFMKRMRMSKQELKDEYKQTEGDPTIKARVRQLRMERARRRMMAQVPNADVVVTNPTHYAVALKYDAPQMNAPVVLAKGIDQVALKIREVAEDKGIPVVENPPLARALHAAVEIDQEVPPEHYRAVAEVISYVFKLRKSGRANRSPADARTGGRR